MQDYFFFALHHFILSTSLDVIINNISNSKNTVYLFFSPLYKASYWQQQRLKMGQKKECFHNLCLGTPGWFSMWNLLKVP
jgi:hypothetical protein